MARCENAYDMRDTVHGSAARSEIQSHEGRQLAYAGIAVPTWYASATSWNLTFASSSPAFLSGWYSLASWKERREGRGREGKRSGGERRRGHARKRKDGAAWSQPLGL